MHSRCVQCGTPSVLTFENQAHSRSIVRSVCLAPWAHSRHQQVPSVSRAVLGQSPMRLVWMNASLVQQVYNCTVSCSQVETCMFSGTYELFHQFCLPCFNGTYSPPASATCLPCPEGTYTEGPGATICLRKNDDSYDLNASSITAPTLAPFLLLSVFI